MEIPLKYDSKKIEQKWYEYWLKNNFFQSNPDSREPYTIIMPPPNVTGVLHMGHMLNNTIQDVLIRRQRLKGKNTCWVPGTDHASIATEAKVVAMLEDMGIDKNNISREEFIEHAWTWTNEYGNIILNQLKKLGCSCDWNRTKFTLDSEMTESVVQVFIDLFNKGLIYKGFRAVNWDPKAKTTLSDEEVIFKEIQGNLYHIKYKIKDSDDFIVVATTRPETIFGDSAICVNPNDDRYEKLIGKEIIVPICNRAVPVIFDEYVDIDFGTGCLKVTPAHDFNDKILGDKHNLEVYDIFNLDATLNELGLEFEGLDRFAARKKVLKKLKSSGQLVKVEDHIHNVGFSERTNVIIEPRLSYQWFLKMSNL
ncbi:MAG: valine--tRNA ligase, partial [Flavobacteriaceae bacterium]|nr:valine--tRNA ligase [Flavobacteriaceae bacterium]